MIGLPQTDFIILGNSLNITEPCLRVAVEIFLLILKATYIMKVQTKIYKTKNTIPSLQSGLHSFLGHGYVHLVF